MQQEIKMEIGYLLEMLDHWTQLAKLYRDTMNVAESWVDEYEKKLYEVTEYMDKIELMINELKIKGGQNGTT